METNTHKKPSIQSLLALTILSIGLLLMVFMIVVESEPGALPLLLILVGSVWFGIQRYRSKT